MRYIFISYSRQQSAVVDELMTRLNGLGVSVWRDTTSLPAGVNWKRQVNDAIRGADLVVMCTSPEWYASQACRNEKDCAAHYHRPSVEIAVDAAAQHPDWAVRTILDALNALTDADRLATDIEVSAGTWIANGGKSRDLARGKYLSGLKRVFGHGRGALTESARRYLAFSVRHQRVRRIMAALAALVVALSMLVGISLRTQTRTIERLGAQSRAVALQRDELHKAQQEGPYQALETVRGFADDVEAMNQTDYVNKLHEVLAVKVPVDAGDAGDSRFADFSFEAARDSADSVGAGDDGGDGAGDAGSQERRYRAHIADDGTVSIYRTDLVSPDAPVGIVSIPGRGKAVTFSPDGLYLAALSDRGIAIIDPAQAAIFMTLSGADTSGATGLAWSGDGARLAVRSSDGRAYVWEVRSRTDIIAQTDVWVMAGTSLAGGKRAAFLGRDGRIAIVDTESGALELTETALVGQHVVATGIAGGADSGTVYVIAQSQQNDEYALYGVDLESHQASRIRLPEGCQPGSVAMSPKATDRLVVDCDARLVILNPASGEVIHTITGYANVTALDVNDTGEIFAGIGGGSVATAKESDGALRLAGDGSFAGNSIGVCVGGVVQSIAAGSDVALAVGNGTTIAQCSRSLRPGSGLGADAWSLGTGLMPYTPDAQSYQARAAAVSPDGSQFAVGLSNGAVALLRADMQPGWTWREQPGEMRAVAYSADGKSVFAATREGLIVRVPAYPESFSVQAMRQEAKSVLDRAAKLGLYEGKNGN